MGVSKIPNHRAKLFRSYYLSGFFLNTFWIYEQFQKYLSSFSSTRKSFFNVSVILDLWSRSWQTQKGKKTPMKAEQFQVMWNLDEMTDEFAEEQNFSGNAARLRIWSISVTSTNTSSLPFQYLNCLDPKPCITTSWMSLRDAQCWPRRSQNLVRHPLDSLPWALLSQMVLSFWRSDGSTAVWLPNLPLEEAIHKSKTVEKVQAICRFGPKYGLRVQQLLFSGHMKGVEIWVLLG